MTIAGKRVIVVTALLVPLLGILTFLIAPRVGLARRVTLAPATNPATNPAIDPVRLQADTRSQVSVITSPPMIPSNRTPKTAHRFP
jgi:hypothetical protein